MGLLAVLENKEIKSILNENAIEEVKVINENLESLVFSDDVEELEMQLTELRNEFKKFQENRKLFFQNLKDDEKLIMTIEKTLTKKGEEAKEKLDKLNEAKTKAFIVMTTSAFEDYFNEKSLNTFDFCDFNFFVKYNALDEKEFVKSKYTTEKEKLAKPGKDLVDKFMNKFQTDRLVIIQGTEEEVALKLKFYKANDYDIEQTVIDFKDHQDMQAEHIAAATKIAEENLQKKLDQEAKEKQMKLDAEEKAKKAAEERKQDEEEAKANKEADEKDAAKIVAPSIEIAEVIDDEIPTMQPTKKVEIEDARLKEDAEFHEKFNKKSTTVLWQLTGKIGDLMKLVNLADRLGIQLERVEKEDGK